MLRSCFLHSFHSFHFLKGHQILIPSKKRNQNNNNVRQGRVIAELYSSQLIASRRHLSKRYYRILLYILQILLIIPQVDSENRISYDHDAVQIWQVTLTHNQQLSWLFTMYLNRIPRLCFASPSTQQATNQLKDQLINQGHSTTQKSPDTDHDQRQRSRQSLSDTQGQSHFFLPFLYKQSSSSAQPCVQGTTDTCTFF